MIPGLPLYIHIIFVLTVLLCDFLFWSAAPSSKATGFGIAVWLLVQGIITLKGFYMVTGTVPPRFALMAAPPFVLIAVLFISKKGRIFLDAFNIRTLTFLHTIRIPVEIVLFLLVVHRQLPEAMSFEGRNLDIISGISAPVVGWLYFDRKILSRNLLLVWNFMCLALVLNVMIYGLLSAQTSFQQLSFEQPNKAVQYFPFSWLPSFVVPVVILSHLISIRRLLKS